jgi:hypothetical protein
MMRNVKVITAIHNRIGCHKEQYSSHFANHHQSGILFLLLHIAFHEKFITRAAITNRFSAGAKTGQAKTIWIDKRGITPHLMAESVGSLTAEPQSHILSQP